MENFNFTSTAKTCYKRDQEKNAKPEVTAVLTQEDLQALQTMMETTIDKKLEPINGRLDAIDVRLDTIENDMAEVKNPLPKSEKRQITCWNW